MVNEPGSAAPGSRRFRDLIERERKDMGWLVHCVAAMYDEISGGRISKPMTYPGEVVGQFYERLSEAAEEAADEARATRDKELARGIEALHSEVCACPGDGSDDGCNWRPSPAAVLRLLQTSLPTQASDSPEKP